MNKTLIPGQIHGTDPQNLMEKIVRTRIHQTRYWNEQCAGLSAETLVDKAIELTEVGGSYGTSDKHPFVICILTSKLNPEKEIIIEFVKNSDYRYLRCLAAFYLRLTFQPKDIYEYLENFYSDYRMIRFRQHDGKLKVFHVDQFMDMLLKEERACDVILPHLNPRRILEESGTLAPRVSILEEELESSEDEDESESEEVKEPPEKKMRRSSRSPRRDSRERRRSPSRRSPSRRRSRSPRRRRHSRSPTRRRRSRSPRRRRSRSPPRRRSRSPRRRRSRSPRRRSRSPRRRSPRRRSRSPRRRSRSPRRGEDRYRRSSRDRRRDDSDRRRSRSKSPDGKMKNLKPWKGKNSKKDSGKSSSSSSSGTSGGGLRDMGVDEMNKLRAELGIGALK